MACLRRGLITCVRHNRGAPRPSAETLCLLPGPWGLSESEPPSPPAPRPLHRSPRARICLPLSALQAVALFVCHTRFSCLTWPPRSSSSLRTQSPPPGSLPDLALHAGLSAPLSDCLCPALVLGPHRYLKLHHLSDLQPLKPL